MEITIIASESRGKAPRPKLKKVNVMKKSDLLEILAAAGIEVNARATVAELEALVAGIEAPAEGEAPSAGYLKKAQFDPEAKSEIGLKLYAERVATEGHYRSEIGRAIGESWTNEATRALRKDRLPAVDLYRDGVHVGEFSSVKKAWVEGAGLKAGRHIPFRGKLREAGSLDLETDDAVFTFTLQS